jgi:6-phosphogluconolactonase (cycloisomerase 2 family)
MDVYSINQSNGILAKMASSAPAVGAFTAASPNGQFLFNDGNGLVEALAINQVNGQLSLAGAAVPTGGSGGPMAVSADGGFLYVANSAQSNVVVYNIGSNGALTPAATPFPTDAQAQSMSLTPDGRFLYIVFSTPQQAHVNGFSVNPATGAFAAIPGALLNNATTINVDASGRFAYVSQSQLVTYSINPATGALTATSQTAQPISDQGTDVVVTP